MPGGPCLQAILLAGLALKRRWQEKRKAAGVTDKVTFLTQDLFESNISEATVVTLYLLPSLNEKLMPKLKRELKPGSRVISHAFSMGDAWPADERGEADDKSYYLWRIADR